MKEGGTEWLTYGYAKYTTLYSVDDDYSGDKSYIDFPSLGTGKPTKTKFGFYAYGQLGIKTKTKTDAGLFKTRVEGGFSSSGRTFNLRYAFAEWGVTPDWTLGLGQGYRPVTEWAGFSTIDGWGPMGMLAGPSRTPEVTLSWGRENNPISFTVSLEKPVDHNIVNLPTLKTDAKAKKKTGKSGGPLTILSDDEVKAYDDATDDAGRQKVLGDEFELMSDSVAAGSWKSRGDQADGEKVGTVDRVPDLGAAFAYNKDQYWVQLTGGLHQFSTDDDDALGWTSQITTGVKLVERVTLETSIHYGHGIGSVNLTDIPFSAWVDDKGKIQTPSALGLYAGLTFKLSDTTSANLAWGLSKLVKDDLDDFLSPLDKSKWQSEVYAGGEGDITREIQTLHANIFYKPTPKWRFGVEVAHGKRWYWDLAQQGGPAKKSADATRVGFGAWAFF
ncbi:MAG: hypothetical protein V6Z86_07935 [Hyphomicrobiales bacterium]